MTTSPNASEPPCPGFRFLNGERYGCRLNDGHRAICRYEDSADVASPPPLAERVDDLTELEVAAKAHPQDTDAPDYDPRVAMLQCALVREAGARLIGNVTAADVAKVAALTMMRCPSCGSEAWVNIDCHVCSVVSKLLEDAR